MTTKKNIEVLKTKQDGIDTIVMENDFYRTVLIPKYGRLPYSFYCKSSKQECFAHPVPLTTPKNGSEFNYYGGLIDSIPWVSGKIDGKTDSERFPIKGYLHFSPWTWNIEKSDNKASWEGKNTFTYNEPITNKESTITFVKKITGYTNSSKLRMEYKIKNTGTGDAKFTLAVHSRTCIDNWHKESYFFTPGDKCYLYELENRQDLAAQGMKLFSWIDWPFEDGRHLSPKQDISYLFTYHPQDWCVTGDAQSEKAFFYITGGLIKYKDRTDTLKMGSFMTNKVQFVQPCISYALQSDEEIWEQPGAVAELQEGEECSFTLYMVSHAKLKEKEVVNLHQVDEDFILLDEPKLKTVTGGYIIYGNAVFSSFGEIIIKINGDILKKIIIQSGNYNFEQIGIIKNPENISLEFNNYESLKKIKLT